jgi:hypothetical protein
MISNASSTPFRRSFLFSEPSKKKAVPVANIQDNQEGLKRVPFHFVSFQG